MKVEFLPGGMVRFNNRMIETPLYSYVGGQIYKEGLDVVFKGDDGKTKTSSN